MDLKHAKILLEKINALYKSISIGEEKIASIEKDLMLSYIRQLYETFLDLDSGTPAPKAKTKAKSKRIETEFEVVAPEPPKRKYKPPRIIEIPDSIKELEAEEARKKKAPPPKAKTPPPPPPKPRPKPTPPPKPAARPASPPPQPVRSGPVDESIEALFEFKKAKELSEKLSQRPVSDLTKALAINDRLLYMNDLFGKDQNNLNAALERLNGYRNMEEAKGLLVEYADQYDWADKDKAKIAKAFIRLVRRRYI